MRRILTWLLCAAILGSSFCGAVSAAPGISAQRAILVDALSGRVLYERDADAKSLIASTTKILTALIVCENCDLSQVVQIPKEAVGVEGSSMYLREGERLTVEQLLYGLMLRSGNDAAVALALHCSGSIEAFAEKMNGKAAQLGMTSSHFVNPHGLDADGHYSTARDLSRLAIAAMENETLRRIAATKSISFGERSLTNHNKLLWRYEGAIGIKTGYTKAAGRILVSAAERNGRRLVCVSINAPNDWSDHAALLDYGYSQMPVQNLVSAGQCMAKAMLLSGETVELKAEEPFFYPLLPGEVPEYKLLCPEGAWQQDELEHAVLIVRLYGKEIGRVELTAQ